MANQVGSKSWRGNRLTSRLGLQYPIIQGPLGGLSSQRLTAAVQAPGVVHNILHHRSKPSRTAKNRGSSPSRMTQSPPSVRISAAFVRVFGAQIRPG